MFKIFAALVTAFFFYMIGSEVVSIVTKKGPNIKRLECYTKSTTFEYVYKKELVKTITSLGLFFPILGGVILTIIPSYTFIYLLTIGLLLLGFFLSLKLK